MANPRRWEHGDGEVGALVPNPSDLAAVRAGQMSAGEYRDRYLEADRFCVDRVAAALRPGTLERSFGMGLVLHGATLCCGCSREAAAEGKCHRAWAAQLLKQAGWRCVLDGQEV